MNKEKSVRLTLCAVGAFAMSFGTSEIAAAEKWDGGWVYTKETHRTIAPATAGGTISGLDAKARGFNATAGKTTVDKWYWTWDASDECPVDFDPPGMMIILK